MAKAGPRKIANYGDRFKATAVKLSSLPGVQIKDAAKARLAPGRMLTRHQADPGSELLWSAGLSLRPSAQMQRFGLWAHLAPSR